jgi:hypothetical protein
MVLPAISVTAFVIVTVYSVLLPFKDGSGVNMTIFLSSLIVIIPVA